MPMAHMSALRTYSCTREMLCAIERIRACKSQWITTADAILIASLVFSVAGLAAVSQTPSQMPVKAQDGVSRTDWSVSFTDWSEVRIKAYKQAMEKPLPSALAVLTVPRLGLHAPLFEGTDDATLDLGLGHIAGTAHPNEIGNLGIAGHRDGFFRPLKDIRAGDTVELTTSGQISTYSVDRVEIVGPKDVRVLKSSRKSTLTLVTCYPFYFYGHAPQRYIVEASLIRTSPQP